MVKKIDNPGAGDCGFYAFSIGLIDIIQKEHERTGKSPTFQRWKSAARNDKKINLENILKLDLHKLRQAPHDYKKELFPLQSALRSMVAEATKQDLLLRIKADAFNNGTSNHVESSPVYGKFMALVKASLERKQLSSNYNELALSPRVKELAEKTAKFLRPKLKHKHFAEEHKIENLHVKQAFLQEVMLENELNSNSVILKGIDEVKQQGRWATHTDLNDIAAVLEVNLSVSGEINGQIEPEKPTVSLNNHGNAHWTTLVELSPKPKPVEKTAKNTKTANAPSKASSEEFKDSYSFIEKQLKLTKAEKKFVAQHSSRSSDTKNDSLKIELAKLVDMRKSSEYQQKLKFVDAKPDKELSDEMLALKLQEKEFKKFGM